MPYIDLNKVLLTPQQVEEMRDDMRGFRKQLEDPRTQDKQAIADRIRRMERQIEEESAHPDRITPSERDFLAKREKELREKITQGMLDEETMRKCPSHAPQEHIDWENANMKDIIQWKSIRRQLDPENGEASNLERYRPRGAQGYGYRSDAVIPGKMSYGTVPPANWDAAFQGKAPEPSKAKKTRGWTPEQKQAASERMKAKHAAIK